LLFVGIFISVTTLFGLRGALNSKNLEISNNVTHQERSFLLKKIFELEGKKKYDLYEDFERVSYREHFNCRVAGRNPICLYSKEIQKLIKGHKIDDN